MSRDHLARPATAADLDDLQRLYRTCFPEQERVAWAEQEQRLEVGLDVALVAVDVDGALIGFALATDLTPDVTALAYLAVERTARSRGVGAALLDAVGARTSAAGGRWVLIEVEPADSPPHPEFGDPARRIAFYTRHGAFVVAHGYAMPATGSVADQGAAALVALDLYALPVGPPPHSPPHQDTVEQWVRCLWGPDYYDLPETDPRFVAVLARLEVPVQFA